MPAPTKIPRVAAGLNHPPFEIFMKPNYTNWGILCTHEHLYIIINLANTANPKLFYQYFCNIGG
jgi:hypothetical protein